MVDIHTHYDVEVLDGPGLAESVRHGVTTVLLGSCSLSTVHVDADRRRRPLRPRRGDPPRARHRTRSTSTQDLDATREEYVEALEALPLGPNLAAFIGHSDMRTAVMGLDRATRKERAAHRRRAGADGAACSPRRSTPASSACRPAAALRQARRRRLPLAHPAVDVRQGRASGAGCKSMLRTARPRAAGRARHREPGERRRRRLAQSLGVVRNPLKTSLLSAADVKANPVRRSTMMGPIARLINRLGGDFRWQHLPVPFEVYADGIDLVIFEEFGSGAAALHLRDEVERNALMRDEDYRRRFRKDYESKFGLRVWHRDFFDAEIVECPDATRDRQVLRPGRRRRGGDCTRSTRSSTWCSSTAPRCAGARRSPTTGPRCSRSWPATPACRSASPTPARTCATWRSTTSGCACCGTSTTPSGAGTPFMTIEQAVHRLTGELADWYGLDAGHLRDRRPRRPRRSSTRRASTTRSTRTPRNPSSSTAACRAWSTATTQTVTAVLVGGRAVFLDGEPTDLVGRRPHGTLPAGRRARSRRLPLGWFRGSSLRFG